MKAVPELGMVSLTVSVLNLSVLDRFTCEWPGQQTYSLLFKHRTVGILMAFYKSRVSVSLSLSPNQTSPWRPRVWAPLM